MTENSIKPCFILNVFMSIADTDLKYWHKFNFKCKKGKKITALCSLHSSSTARLLSPSLKAQGRHTFRLLSALASPGCSNSWVIEHLQMETKDLPFSNLLLLALTVLNIYIY